MYCSGCGESLDDGASFCHVCGRTAHGRSGTETPRTDTRTNLSNESAYLAFHKSEGIAIILGLLIIGAGQMYVGKLSRGIGIFLFGIFGWIFALVPFFLLDLAVGGSGIVFLLMFGAFLLMFVIWSLYDAHELVKKYNTELLLTGRPPW